MKKDKHNDAYLAPLNFDRFFKKVFSNLDIAKKFIEDFLNIEIQHIEKLDTDKRLSDNSDEVRFDFRCKIDGKHVVIEMQQWDKPDIVQRFFLYFCVTCGYN